MSLSRSFEQSCLVCIALQSSCFFPESPGYKSILLLPSADSPHFWESNTAPKEGGPAGWKQKPADTVASSDSRYAEWNITYLTVWFTNFSGGAQLVGRWTVKRQDKDLRSAIFWTSKQKRKKKNNHKTQDVLCYLNTKHCWRKGEKFGLGTFLVLDLCNAMHWCACFLHK